MAPSRIQPKNVDVVSIRDIGEPQLATDVVADDTVGGWRGREEGKSCGDGGSDGSHDTKFGKLGARSKDPHLDCGKGGRWAERIFGGEGKEE